VGAEFVREVKPGEMVIVTENGIESFQIEESKTKVDIFEFVYFARPDSQFWVNLSMKSAATAELN